MKNYNHSKFIIILLVFRIITPSWSVENNTGKKIRNLKYEKTPAMALSLPCIA